MPSSNLKMHTPNLVDSNIERIAELFPNCITEKPKTDEQGNVLKDASGQAILERGIDFELLKQELSHSVIDGSQERYRLDWVGKREAIVTANSPIAKTLRPCRAESVDFDTTGNLFIEGDNLEALKLLQESYLGKVKMIYIDPPYNTGNDFIYNDDFAADTAAFFERSGQVDADGNRLVANTESNGRFHSDWLSMMYSRLKLARNLLADDGFIFLSINDRELHNLKKIGDEIFGISNFLTTITRATGTPTGGGNDAFVNEVDYIIVYSKTVLSANIIGTDMSEEDAKIYDRTDEKGKYLIRPLRRTGGEDKREDRPSMYYSLTAPDGTKVYPIAPAGYESRWICGKEKYEKMVEEGLIEWKRIEKNGIDIWQVYQKFYLEGRKKLPGNLWVNLEGNKKATRDIRTLFDTKKVFDFPKPIGLIEYILSIIDTSDAIILDFFAGSSTTAHAVMQMNMKDGGNRKFIMVQIDESINKEKQKDAYELCLEKGIPTTIAEISKERIRRAGAKIKADNADKDGINELDTGFRVLKIDTSNMNDIYYRPQDYSQDLLHQLENNIKEDRSDEDLLFQFMLDTGVPLSLPIERTQLPSKSGGHTIYQVGGNSLIASLDYIDATMVNDIAALNPLKFITSERAIATDSDKTNIKERFKQLSPHTDVRFI